MTLTLDDAFDDITDSVFIFPRKHKAPKNHRARDHVAGVSRNCKGICDRIGIPKPFKGYRVAAFCTRCGNGGSHDGVWILLTDLKENGRCPCCNFRPRQKNFKQ